MKTIILYTTRHGTTKKIAQRLADMLQCSAIDLNQHSYPPLTTAHCIVLGTSIHMGKGDKKMMHFCEKNKELFKTKSMALFITCLLDTESEQQFTKAYPEWLRHQSNLNAIFGGELVVSQMHFIEKILVKVLDRQKPKILSYSEENIVAFARKLLQQ